MSSVNNAARQSEARRIVKALGGPSTVMRLLEERGIKISRQGVRQWHENGISHRMRGVIKAMCDSRGIPLPPGFATLGAE